MPHFQENCAVAEFAQGCRAPMVASTEKIDFGIHHFLEMLMPDLGAQLWQRGTGVSTIFKGFFHQLEADEREKWTCLNGA
jgi:hypothetical protein